MDAIGSVFKMASESLNLDDILATLMSMGFDLQDCQDAVSNGKLTVQSAIDWILAGKPGNASVPSLKLNKQPPPSLQADNSNPFVPGNTSSLAAASVVQPSVNTSEHMGLDVDDNAVVSRSHLSDKQQQIKLDFEEKERQKARKMAQEEKQKKKIERERILKEIQADREKVKMTKGGGNQGEEAATVAQPAQPPQPTEPQPSCSASAPENLPDTTTIQIRLPSSQVCRMVFSSDATLNDVWDALYEKVKTAMHAHSGFIQPFPRREFTKTEMGRSLQELGLVPSGNLVLKKKDAQQAASVEPVQNVEGEDMDAENENEEPSNDEEADAVTHQWGLGHRVEDGQEDRPMEVDENQRALGFDPFDDANLGLHQLGQLPRYLPPPSPEQNMVFPAGFGNRLIPEGIPQDHGRHLNRRAADMAAEAAAQRYAAPKPKQDEGETSHYHPESIYHVPNLQHMAMSLLARRLADPRNRMYSVSGLSEDLLQAFLVYLKKENMLRPKILHLIPSYLLKLVLDYYPYTTNELLHAARVFTNLHVLSLAACSLITDNGLNAIKGLKSLRVLNLNGCSQITDLAFPVFYELKNLQTLNLDGTKVTDNGVKEFVSQPNGPSLVSLDLSRTSVSNEIFFALQNFKSLKCLSLKQTKLTSLAGLEGITCLESLDISDTNIVTESILCVVRLPKLSHICLTGTFDVHGDRALSYLKDMKITALLLPSRSTTTDLGMSYISGFHLSALDLTNYTNVGDNGVACIAKIRTLKKLLLTNTKISDVGAHHLKSLELLELLILDRTLITSHGASVVKHLKELNELSLSGTCITNELLLGGSLNGLQKLTKLNLSRTIVGDKGIRALALPNLQNLNLECTHVHLMTVKDFEGRCPHLKTVLVANLSAVMEAEEG